MRVTTNYDPRAGLAKIGDHRVPNRWTVTVEDDDEPTIEAEVEVRDGRPVLTVLTLRKREGILTRDLRLPLERYAGVLPAFGAFRVTRTDDDGRERLSLVSGADAEALLGQVQGRRRRRMTDEFLSAVASAYDEAGGVSGVTADSDPRFYGASDSQKFRWVKAARERGLLSPRVDR